MVFSFMTVMCSVVCCCHKIDPEFFSININDTFSVTLRRPQNENTHTHTHTHIHTDTEVYHHYYHKHNDHHCHYDDDYFQFKFEVFTQKASSHDILAFFLTFSAFSPNPRLVAVGFKRTSRGGGV